MDKNEEADLWKDAVVVSVYTRRQTIEDGVLVAVDDWAREAGFRFAVAMTAGVWQALTPSPALEGAGQDIRGRVWDVLMVMRAAIRSGSSDRVTFAPLILRDADKRPEPLEMWAHCGPGDDGERVITIMLEGED